MADDYDPTYGEGPQEPRREVEPEPQPCTECGGGWHNECSRTVCTDHGRWHPCPCAMRGHKAMTRREDHGSTTPEQAAAFEARRGADDHYDDRPTLAEATRDEYGTDTWLTSQPPPCAHLHQKDEADLNDPWAEPVWTCVACGQVCDE